MSSSIGCWMSPNGFSTELSAVFSLVLSFLGSEDVCFESDCFEEDVCLEDSFLEDFSFDVSFELSFVFDSKTTFTVLLSILTLML